LHERTLKAAQNVRSKVLRYRLDDLVIDAGTRRVMRGNVDLQVNGLSFDLLMAMGEVAPNLLSADELNERVWPGQIVSAETIAQRIKLVRQLLGDSASNPRYIAGLRGHGYRLLSPLLPLQKDARAAGEKSRAFELYVQARAIVRGTSESKDDALRFLDEALALDPELAPALAHRALLQAGAVPLTGAPRDWLDLASRDATRALELDPAVADAHVALGLVCADRRQWIDARNHFDAAREMEPANAFVNNLYALSVLRPTGQLNEARAQLTETYRTMPADGFTLHELILTHSLLGDDAGSLRYASLSKTLSGLPNPPWDVVLALARAEARRGAFADAAALTIKALPRVLREKSDIDVVDAFFAALAQPSLAPRACRLLESFAPRLQAPTVDSRTRAFFVVAFAMLGDLDGAYALLDRLLFASLEEQWTVDLSDLWCPEMQAFRADRRFHALVERLGLASYWGKFGSSPR
jgi:DNA-binding winged helix-turn-helix (wHTH) protein